MHLDLPGEPGPHQRPGQAEAEHRAEDDGGYRQAFERIERYYNVGIVYGRRTFRDGLTGTADLAALLGAIGSTNPAADLDKNGLVDLADAMYLIQWRFLAGPAPKAPFPACGEDPTADGLECEAGSYTHCP